MAETHFTNPLSALGNMPALSANSIARQQAIENALSMALHFIRHGDSHQDIHAATGRAIRATSLLKQACAELAIEGSAA